jgi:hypothetical protein
VLGFIGSKVRKILSLLTGVRPKARIPKQKEKSEHFDLSQVKNPELKGFLERWKARGEVIQR